MRHEKFMQEVEKLSQIGKASTDPATRAIAACLMTLVAAYHIGEEMRIGVYIIEYAKDITKRAQARKTEIQDVLRRDHGN